jgi:hypothetical protein
VRSYVVSSEDIARRRKRESCLLLGLYAILFVLSQVPLYLVQHPDITDFPNHLARFYILRHLADSPALQQHYAAAPVAAVPNLAMEVCVPWLCRWLDPALALKVFATLSTLLMTSGAIAFARAITGRLTVCALSAVLFANSAVLQLGLFNYLFGLGLAFWLLAAWACAPRWRARAAGITFFALGALLVYFCHLSAFGVYALGIAALQSRITVRPRWPWLAVHVHQVRASVLPFVPVAVLLALTVARLGTHADAMHGSLVAVLAYKLAMLALAPGAALAAYPAERAVCGATVAAGAYVALRHRLVTLPAAARRMALLLVLAMALLPPAVFGSALADSRLVLPLGLVVWCAADLADPRWRLRVAALVACAAAVLTAATGAEWLQRDREYAAVRRAYASLPPGSTLATVNLDDRATGVSPYLAGWAVVDRQVFMSNLYAQPFEAVGLRYRRAHVAHAARGRTENVRAAKRASVESVRGRFDYVLLLGGDGNPRARMAGEVLYASKGVELVRGR